MKRLPSVGCLVALFVFLLIGGVVSCGVISSFTGTPEPYVEDLEASVEAVIVSTAPREGRPDEGWVDYTYVVDGDTFESGTGYFTADWDPAAGLTICYDAESPEEHAALVVPGPECGDDDLKVSKRDAELAD